MALKNDPDLSAFGKRLSELIDSYGFKSPAKLAEHFYTSKLIIVNHHKDSLVDRKEANAIDTIKKAIEKDIKSGPSCLRGDYVLAYCKVFECSIDFLFCKTNIKSPNINLQVVCRDTGLSEKAIQRLIDSMNDSNTEGYPRWWSSMIESDLYFGICKDTVRVHNHKIEMLKNKALLEAEKYKYERSAGPVRLEYQCNMEGYEQEIEANAAAISGLLFNISRGFANYVDFRTEAEKELFYHAFKEDCMRLAERELNSNEGINDY